MRFLFFSYTLPTKAAKGRVQVWRQLKKTGAISYRGLWVIPFNKERIPLLEELAALVLSLEGESLVFEGKLLNDADEGRVLDNLGEASRLEYTELLDKCADYLKEIEKETAAENFIFAEVEENEEELEKLKNWFKKIQKRQIVEIPEKKQAITAIAKCEEVFEQFSAVAYERADKA